MNSAASITCPNCSSTFELNSAIEQPIIDRIKASFDAERAREQQKLAADRAQLAKDQAAARELSANAEVKARELARELANKEKQKIVEEQRALAAEQNAVELSDLKNQLVESKTRLQKTQDAELAIRKQKRELEQKQAEFDLTFQRQQDELRESITREKQEEHRLQLAERDKRNDDLVKTIDDLKRKAEQGSQQTQGEVLELDLESRLRECFFDDDLMPVPKGVNGCDVVQLVRSPVGHECGTIAWETKRAKKFDDKWTDKLKQDMQTAKAQLGVIVTTSMPKGISGFGQIDCVWVCSPLLAMPVGAALRHVLLETAAARRAIEGRQDKISVLYDYMTGPQFSSRFVAIVEAFAAMKNDLDDERRKIQALWAKREKQIERVLNSSTALWGELQGIAGHSLPRIEMLELLEPIPSSRALPDTAVRESEKLT